jgi:uncharacterized protein (TIGR02145 family)
MILQLINTNVSLKGLSQIGTDLHRLRKKLFICVNLCKSVAKNLKIFVLILLCILGVNQVFANNLTITNSSLQVNPNTSWVYVQFDISWENSWRTSTGAANWDAAWVFIKYRVGSGDWQHAKLSPEANDHIAPTGSSIFPTADSMGVFIYRDTNGTGNVNFSTAKLAWKYAADGVAGGASIDFKVLGIEMVYVPQGSFWLGDGSSYFPFRQTGSNTPAQVTSNSIVIKQEGSNNNAGDAVLENGLTINGVNGICTTGNGAIDNTDYPTGYKAFYCMKYELSQGQYAAFLNLLTSTQAATRYPNNNGQYRYTISGTYPNFLAAAPDRACNFLSWADGAAYTDWSGLRPMTELEYEKACRGPLNAVTGEYAWGNTSIFYSWNYTLANDGTSSESISNCDSNIGNASWNSQFQGPVRCGIFAASAVNKTRQETGASFYGIFEMSGNLFERTISLGNPSGRAFTGLNGNGRLSSEGDANVSAWPGIDANGAGLKGGSWLNYPGWFLWISYRNLSSYITTTRSETYGFRCARAASPALLPVLTTTAVIGINSFSAICGGEISSDGGESIITRGVCWSRNPNPTLSDSKTSDGSATGSYVSSLTGLDRDSAYYVRAYAISNVGTVYGNELNFTASLTVGQPYLGGIIAYILQPGDPSYSAVQTRGLIAAPSDQSAGAEWGCYGTILTGADGTALGTGSQNTIEIIAGCLTAGTAAKLCEDLVLGGYSDWYLPSKDDIYKLYLNRTAIGGFASGNYWCSSEYNNFSNFGWLQSFVNGSQFAYNKNELEYVRSVRSFPSAPSITTTEVSFTSLTSATIGGIVLGDGGLPVITRGVCWNTSMNPTISDSKTIDGTGTGTFSSSMTALSPFTTYYVKAYATNSVGTVYGNEIRIISPLTDVEGNLYKTIQIGNQIWMAENLKATKYNDNTEIPLITDLAAWATLSTPGFCWYNNDSASYNATFGLLYNWFTVNTNKICPSGWHVPSNSEWTILTDYLGGELIAGGKLKETGLAHWSNPNAGATNEVGFNALPGGWNYYNGAYWDFGLVGNWWCFTELNGSYAWARRMYYHGSNINGLNVIKRNGFSIRCLRDTVATVTTQIITGITSNSAEGGGEVTNEGPTSVIARGVCWSTSTNPTISDNKTSNGLGTGTFASSITGLSSGTLYYVRAYVTNSAGTSYGDEISFTTNSIPVLTTTEASAITTTTAICGGNITSDGGSPLIERGVCWSTYANPTFNDNKTTDGSATGGFTSSLTGLNPSTTYYARAYATNSLGTNYGNEITFITYEGTVSDIQGNVYKTIQIGSQTWMTENLKTIKYKDGTGIPLTYSYSTPCYCWYNNDSVSNCANNGALYNWYTINTGSLCPTGWHIPADTEWKTLEMYLGMTQQEADAIGGRGTDQGIQLKNSSGWDNGGNGTNTSGFRALPSGTREGGGGFFSLGYGGAWWSSTESSSIGAIMRSVDYNYNKVGRGEHNKDGGFSVRCLLDSLPTVNTQIITGITSTSAESGGDVTNEGASSVSSRGVCWSTAPNPTIASNICQNGAGTGFYSCSITGLSPGTLYYLRTFATNNHGTSYGDQISFTTHSLPLLTTNSATLITSISATCGGDITYDGGTAVTQRGICWNTVSNPTILNNKTIDGSGTGVFTSSISTLTPGTIYYIRAYAINAVGTVYGNEISFTTLNPPQVNSVSASSVAFTTATLNAQINANNFSTVVSIEYGATTSYGSTIMPTQSPVGGNVFTGVSANLTGLSQGTIYHFRIKAVSSEGTTYSDDVTFATLQPPTVSSIAASSVTDIGAILNGTVNANNSSATVTFEYGLTNSYGTSITAIQSPVTGSSVTNASAAIGGLSQGTTYHFRIKAVSPGGTRYGNDLTFITLLPPAAITKNATDIKVNSSCLEGTVNPYNSSATITFEYGLTTAYGSSIYAVQSPVTGSSIVPVSIYLTGLSASTAYHYRVRAENSVGISYGDDITFTTLSTSSLLTDLDGNVYNTVLIGTQIWMQENLESHTYSNGEAISRAAIYNDWETDTIGLYETNTVNNSYTICGEYYNGYAAMDVRNVCPAGWHVPNSSEWSTLITYCGGESIAGLKLKTTGYWGQVNGTNESNFSAIPNGLLSKIYFGYYAFTGMGAWGNWWTSSIISSNVLSSVGMAYTGTGANIGGVQMNVGYGIRCIKGELPLVETTSSTSITSTSASLNGKVNPNLVSTIVTFEYGTTTAYGQSIEAIQSPILDSGPVNVSANLSGLLPGTTYHFRVVATNSGGTTFGGDLGFTTITLPTLLTSNVSLITPTSATSGGSIINDGGSLITSRGTCWGTSANPTIADYKKVDGSGAGEFSSSISGLTSGTTYFIRAYATNSSGTAYGNELNFSTLLPNQVADIEGNVYSTVPIGTQIWMKENLKTKKFNDNTNIPLVTDGLAWAALLTPGFCWFNNDSASYGSTYGALYNWYSINSGKLCPTGWHVPSDSEWTVLTDYLGGEGIAGGKLKEVGYTHWGAPNVGATNETDFTALPGGYRVYINGNFYQIGSSCYWWTSTPFDSNYGWYRDVYFDGSNVYRYGIFKQNGFSVRCLQD